MLSHSRRLNQIYTRCKTSKSQTKFMEKCATPQKKGTVTSYNIIKETRNSTAEKSILKLQSHKFSFYILFTFQIFVILVETKHVGKVNFAGQKLCKYCFIMNEIKMFEVVFFCFCSFIKVFMRPSALIQLRKFDSKCHNCQKLQFLDKLFKNAISTMLLKITS